MRVAKAYIKDSNLTVGVFIPDAAPDRAAVPNAPELAPLFTNFKSSIAVSRAEEFDPTPANIERRVVRSKLANGMKVAMLPQEDGGRDGVGGDRTAFRRRQIARRPECRGAACRQPADERDEDTKSRSRFRMRWSG